ncbi:plastocyanin/azurin family copper-binding protein [Opitutus sp. ER46]|uniref:plastocyanin/azurin family copper-binding protein n=1 Tax=Opitutus sp. ER46 TaxID=2161864 RepID=UPI000D319896|nr:plastocyanin/azurin family copper-binding protein [Opitutus sp. ER46]PTX96657.1 azurin [Opitutus sp. ER46]
MKHTSTTLILGTALVAALLSGCGRSSSDAGAPSASAPAAKASEAAKPESGRAIQFTANDTMKFNMTEIHASPGEALSVTLTNEGTTPKFSMGHNWVLFTADIDLPAFVQESATAAATDYIPASFRPKVIAATKLLGPKESDTVTFFAPKTPGRYPFICSFPGHMQVGMKGELIVE